MMELKAVEGSNIGFFSRMLSAPLRMALRRTLSRYKGSPVTYKVVFSNGSDYQNQPGEPELSIRFKNMGAELRTVLFTDMGFLDSYFGQTIDIHGDIATLTKLDAHTAEDLVTKNANGPHSNPLNVLRNWWHKVRHDARSLAQAKANSDAHYDLPNEYFEMVLCPFH